MQVQETDVAVVGAGLAGLAAARALVAGGRDVVVLEARDRPGGRVLNQAIGGGEIVEGGAQWIGPTQDRLAALAADAGVATFPTHGQGEHVVDWGGRLRRYRGAIPRISPAVLADFAQAQRRLDAMAKAVPPEAPWSAPRAERWDEGTWASWMRRSMATRGARELMTTICQAVWAGEPSEVSLLHALFYIRSAGGLDMLVGTEGGAQQDRFLGGSQRIALVHAERLGHRVRYGSPVRRIDHGPGGVAVHADGITVRAEQVVVTVPVWLAGRIGYDPPLPALRDQLTQRMPAGAVVKCHAVYDEPFWRAAGLTGQGASDAGPVRVTFDNSPPSGRPGVLLGFLEGRAAREWGARPARERRAAVLGVFARLFGTRALRPDAYVEQAWAQEEWTRGCYAGYLGPGGWTQFGPALRAPVGPIRWAGAEYATRWMGYMDGAVRSGEEQAAAILAQA